MRHLEKRLQKLIEPILRDFAKRIMEAVPEGPRPRSATYVANLLKEAAELGKCRKHYK